MLEDLYISENRLPPRTLYKKFSKTFLDKRKVLLEQYMTWLINCFPVVPPVLIDFLMVGYYDMNLICQRLTKMLFESGEKFLSNNLPFTFNFLQVVAISRRLRSPLQNPDTPLKPDNDLAHLYSFVSQLKHVRVCWSQKDKLVVSNEDLILDFSPFTGVETIELISCRSSRLDGLLHLRSKLRELIVMKSITQVQDFTIPFGFYRGGCSDIADFVESDISSILRWTNLIKVSFSSNELKMVDPSIALMPNLISLDLSSNFLLELPCLLSLLRLQQLDLSYNMISSIPDQIHDHLGSVTHLNLSSNRIKSAYGLHLLLSLTHLDLSFNSISEVDSVHCLGHLPLLQDLRLHDNPVCSNSTYRQEILGSFGERFEEVSLDCYCASEKEAKIVRKIFAKKNRAATQASPPVVQALSLSGQTPASTIIQSQEIEVGQMMFEDGLLFLPSSYYSRISSSVNAVLSSHLNRPVSPSEVQTLVSCVCLINGSADDTACVVVVTRTHLALLHITCSLCTDVVTEEFSVEEALSVVLLTELCSIRELVVGMFGQAMKLKVDTVGSGEKSFVVYVLCPFQAGRIVNSLTFTPSAKVFREPVDAKCVSPVNSSLQSTNRAGSNSSPGSPVYQTEHTQPSLCDTGGSVLTGDPHPRQHSDNRQETVERCLDAGLRGTGSFSTVVGAVPGSFSSPTVAMAASAVPFLVPRDMSTSVPACNLGSSPCTTQPGVWGNTAENEPAPLKLTCSSSRGHSLVETWTCPVHRRSSSFSLPRGYSTGCGDRQSGPGPLSESCPTSVGPSCTNQLAQQALHPISVGFLPPRSFETQVARMVNWTCTHGCHHPSSLAVPSPESSQVSAVNPVRGPQDGCPDESSYPHGFQYDVEEKNITDDQCQMHLIGSSSSQRVSMDDRMSVGHSSGTVHTPVHCFDSATRLISMEGMLVDSFSDAFTEAPESHISNSKGPSQMPLKSVVGITRSSCPIPACFERSREGFAVAQYPTTGRLVDIPSPGALDSLHRDQHSGETGGQPQGYAISGGQALTTSFPLVREQLYTSSIASSLRNRSSSDCYHFRSWTGTPVEYHEFREPRPHLGSSCTGDVPNSAVSATLSASLQCTGPNTRARSLSGFSTNSMGSRASQSITSFLLVSEASGDVSRGLLRDSACLYHAPRVCKTGGIDGTCKVSMHRGVSGTWGQPLMVAGSLPDISSCHEPFRNYSLQTNLDATEPSSLCQESVTDHPNRSSLCSGEEDFCRCTQAATAPSPSEVSHVSPLGCLRTPSVSTHLAVSSRSTHHLHTTIPRSTNTHQGTGTSEATTSSLSSSRSLCCPTCGSTMMSACTRTSCSLVDGDHQVTSSLCQTSTCPVGSLCDLVTSGTTAPLLTTEPLPAKSRHLEGPAMSTNTTSEPLQSPHCTSKANMFNLDSPELCKVASAALNHNVSRITECTVAYVAAVDQSMHWLVRPLRSYLLPIALAANSLLLLYENWQEEGPVDPVTLYRIPQCWDMVSCISLQELTRIESFDITENLPQLSFAKSAVLLGFSRARRGRHDLLLLFRSHMERELLVQAISKLCLNWWKCSVPPVRSSTRSIDVTRCYCRPDSDWMS